MVYIYTLMTGQLVLYVGRTSDPTTRRQRHRRRQDTTGSAYIPDYIEWEMVIVEQCAKDVQIEREQYHYDTLKPLYNINRPGQTMIEYISSGAGRAAKARANAKYRAKFKASVL